MAASSLGVSPMGTQRFEVVPSGSRIVRAWEPWGTALVMAAVRLPPRPARQAQPAGPLPRVPSAVSAAASTLFGGLSRLRGARVFHPKGVGYSATLTVDRPRPEYAGAPLFAEAMEHPALVRLSYAAGLPDRWPVALGLALRLLDVHGPGR